MTLRIDILKAKIMKYITTGKHPELKEGTKIMPSPSNESVWVTSLNIQIFTETIVYWENEKWIKELQEPKWTDEDMILFGNFVSRENDFYLKQQLEAFKNIIEKEHGKERNTTI